MTISKSRSMRLPKGTIESPSVTFGSGFCFGTFLNFRLAASGYGLEGCGLEGCPEFWMHLVHIRDSIIGKENLDRNGVTMRSGGLDVGGFELSGGLFTIPCTTKIHTGNCRRLDEDGLYVVDGIVHVLFLENRIASSRFSIPGSTRRSA